MRADDRMLRPALAYAERFRFAVFPCHWIAPDGSCSCGAADCKSPGKHPLTEHGVKDATKDPAQIREWWKRWPAANVAIATGAASGILVLDVDPRHGGDESLAALEAVHGKLPDASTALTGGGGLHFYFREPDGATIRNSAGALGPGLDIRRDGGYIVAPPSNHATGREYAWKAGTRIDQIAPPALPSWLLEKLTTAIAVDGKSAPRFETAAAFEEGARNDSLYRFARSQRARHKLSLDELLPLLRAVNQSRCKPPVPDAEVEQIARNAIAQPDAPGFSAQSAEMQAVAALWNLDPIARAIAKKALAKKLKVPVKAIDEALAACRPAAQEAESLAAPPPEPWPEPVEARALLDELRNFIARFVIVDDHALTATTLWIAFTHAFEIAETSPRLAILSPVKGCGKTRVLDLLELLCPRTIKASNLTPAAIFRVIDAEHPTLLIDEADSFVHGNEELRGLLNAGHSRGAYVVRNVPVGDRWMPKKFSTWAAIAVAAIGSLPETWIDRSIVVSMKRKLRTQSVERLTRRNIAAREQAAALASQLARFAADNLELLKQANPVDPALDGDRAINNWEHLLAIADLATGDWPERARAAAVTLAGGRDDGDDSLAIKLLTDIRTILESNADGSIGSTSLCEQLNQLEVSPWSAISRGRPLTANRLARMLKGFELRVKKIDRGKARGYMKTDFEDAFARYLPPLAPDQSVQASSSQRGEGKPPPSEVSDDGALKSAATHTAREGEDTLTLSNPEEADVIA